MIHSKREISIPLKDIVSLKKNGLRSPLSVLRNYFNRDLKENKVN